MSLQTRLSALITAVGADAKDAKTRLTNLEATAVLLPFQARRLSNAVAGTKDGVAGYGTAVTGSQTMTAIQITAASLGVVAGTTYVCSGVINYKGDGSGTAGADIAFVPDFPAGTFSDGMFEGPIAGTAAAAAQRNSNTVNDASPQPFGCINQDLVITFQFLFTPSVATGTYGFKFGQNIATPGATLAPTVSSFSWSMARFA